MELTNSAQITSYTFPISPSTTGTGTAEAESLTIDILPATINFTKSNTPSHIEPGDTVTVTYSINNLNNEDITSAEILDSIFTMPGVTATIISGGTIIDNRLTVTLNPTIKQNDSAQAVVSLVFDKTAPPNNSLYDTIATGNLIVNTLPPSTVTKTSKGHLEVNSAILTINKTVSPSLAAITAGNLLTYSIEVANTGNVEATIGIGQFVDSWPAGRLTNVETLNTGFQVVGSKITNNIVLTIPAESSKTLIYTALSL